jgi:hypothetical protein
VRMPQANPSIAPAMTASRWEEEPEAITSPESRT